MGLAYCSDASLDSEVASFLWSGALALGELLVLNLYRHPKVTRKQLHPDSQRRRIGNLEVRTPDRECYRAAGRLP